MYLYIYIYFKSDLNVFRAIGRFALNHASGCNDNISEIDSNEEMTILLQSKVLKGIFTIANKLYGIKQSVGNNESINIRSIRSNCCSLIYGIANNMIRHEMYSKYLCSLDKCHSTKVLRFDTDSICISQINTGKEEENNFISCQPSAFDYKKEIEGIKEIINMKKQSHIIKTKQTTILKTPGLNLTLFERNKIRNMIV